MKTARTLVITQLLRQGWQVARVKGDGAQPLSVTLRQSPLAPKPPQS